MRVSQIFGKRGVLADDEGACRADYKLALNHVSDVTGEFSSTGTGGTYQGSLTSRETVNDTMDVSESSDPDCETPKLRFAELCTGSGSEENVIFSIDSQMGKYTISFPQTGIDCPISYSVPTLGGGGALDRKSTVLKKINDEFMVDYPRYALDFSPSDPVTTLEFPLPSGSQRVIKGETTFPHFQYPQIPITWSWELTPDKTGPESELGFPQGEGKATGGSFAPGSGYGEPVWTVNTANLNIFITDSPMWYRSPIGPQVEITVSYNSQSVSAMFEPIGSKWQLNYESYLSADQQTGDVTIYMPDGRRDVYKNSGAGFTPPYRVFNELRMTRKGGLEEGSDYELRFPDGTVYVYKVPSGSLLWAFLTEIRDAYGNKLSLLWQAIPNSPWGGQLRQITDAMGRITTVFPDSNNRIGSIQDPFGRRTYFQYDADGNLTRITDMGGYATTFSYDGCGNIQSMIMGSNSVHFEQDALGLTVRDNMGLERFSLNAQQGTASYQGANAEEGSIYSYIQSPAQDGSDHKDITKFQTPEGVSYDFTYDPKGNLLTDTLNASTGNETSEYQYNAKGKVTYIRDPRGTITNLRYGPNNVDLLELKNGLGAISATYNDKHDILSLTNRQGKTKYFTYNAFGQLERSIDTLGIQTDYIYNGDHQLVKVVRGGNVVAVYGYDKIGRVNFYTDINGYALRYAYNDLDDLLSVAYPDNTTTTFSRSPSVPHLLDGTIDQALRQTKYKYNAHKQLQEIGDPEEGHTKFNNDPAGNIKELTDPNRNSTFIGYNKDNQVTSKTYEDGSQTSLSYTDRRLTRSRNARGIETSYTYDKNGNLLTIRYSDATPGVTIAYDEFNRAIRIEDGLGIHIKTYDANSRIKSVDGAWAKDTLTFNYDDLGRRTSIALENGPTTAYSYDSLNRLTKLVSNGLVYTYTYQSGTNLLEKLERPDGSRTEYAYDPIMKRLQRLTNRHRAGGVLNEYAFTFDPLGQPKEETATNGPALQFMEAAAAYTYNNINQAVTFDGSDAVFSYDADGNMTRGLTGDGKPFEAAYDAENRMVSIQFTDKSGAARRQEFSYGYDGFIGIQKDYAAGVLTREQRFIRDGVTTLQVRNGSNTVERNYLWGVAEAGGVGALLALVQGGQTYQYYSNPRGDITAVLDNAGAVVATYAYDPFGQHLAAAGTLKQPMRFSTKAFDEGTGLYYFGYRFYSPKLGRWLSRDPLVEKGSINLYSFSSNNPITKFDPNGARDFEREKMAQNLDQLEDAVKKADEEGRLEKIGPTLHEKITEKFGELKETIEKKLKEKAVEKICEYTPICISLERREFYRSWSKDFKGASGGFEIGIGLTDGNNARGDILRLRLKIEVKILEKFNREAEFSTEFGDMSRYFETVTTVPLLGSRRQ